VTIRSLIVHAFMPQTSSPRSRRHVAVSRAKLPCNRPQTRPSSTVEARCPLAKVRYTCCRRRAIRPAIDSIARARARCHVMIGWRWCHGSNGTDQCVASRLEALWMSGRAHGQPISTANARVAKFNFRRAGTQNSELASPLAPASSRPPNPSWCPVSSLCCPRNLLLPRSTLRLLSLRVAPTAVPPLHAPLCRHTPRYRNLIAECDGHIVILDAAHTIAPAAAS
jgi:hypothetical protein